MFFVICLLVVIITVSVAGGLVYNLLEKNKALKSLQTERSKTLDIIARAAEIIEEANEKGRGILQNANDKLIELNAEINNAREQIKNTDAELEILKTEEDKARQKNNETLEALKAEELKARRKIIEINETFDLNNLNFYESHFNFDKALDYERALSSNRSLQKNLIKAEKATVIDLYTAGAMFACKNVKRIVNLLSKLLIRTFNSECDLLLEKVDYKNIVIYENRIKNTFEQLNKLTLTYGVELADDFLNLKIDELRILHEYQEKKQAEAEEQRQIKEIMREEIRAEREMEKQKEDAEKEIRRYQELLERAQAAAMAAHGAEIEKKNAQIALLQEQMQSVVEKVKAISQAQMTKTGYVYIISNIGSFGENVYKIGMTRRLEPQERVDELGSAAVPFAFDVHAMIRHENAPELETKLHQAFEWARINKVNPRKEFYRLTLEEIEQEAKKFDAEVIFTKIAEAKEYRQSLLIEQEKKIT